jgi:CubicO group peptidase (beta-lactamase class C family)
MMCSGRSLILLGWGGLLAVVGACGGGEDDAGGAQPLECHGMPMPPRALNGDGAAPPADAAWPTGGWAEADPADVGMDAAALEAALDFTTESSETRAILVARHGRIVAERYAGEGDPADRHTSYSMAKGVTSALVGMAIDRGLLEGTDARVCAFYDEWDCDDADDPRSRITVQHLMNLTSGLQWQEDWSDDAQGVNDVILGFADLVGHALSKPAEHEPGEVMRYSTGDPALLTGVLEGATGQTAFAFAQEALFGPLGITGATWDSDVHGRTTTYAGLSATVRDYARFGYLYLRQGAWDGDALVPADWVTRTTQPEDRCGDWYRYLWHVNPPIRLGAPDPACGALSDCPPLELADLPADTFFAQGIFGQFILVVPSADLVVVRVASDDPGSEGWDAYARGLLDRLLDAVVDDPDA